MNMPRCRLAFAGLLFAIGLAMTAGAADVFTSVYISECLSENQRGLKDDDGERSPWIELGNASRSPVNLAGWFLTDTPTNLTKWRLPGVVLLPEKFILVFASGKDRIQDLAHLHTNFRLHNETGYLALVNPATNIVNELRPARQPAGHSFGSLRGELSWRAAFQKPTPGKPNTASGSGFSGEPAFSRPGGTFTESFTLALSSQTTTGAVIRYTVDGSLPTTNSPAYEAALLITNTAHVRARIYEHGLLPGSPRSEAYLKLSTNVVGFNSTLPLLVMETFGKNIPVYTHGAFGQLSFFEPANGRASLTNPPTLMARMEFHQRGSTSGGMPQPGFALDLVDEFNEPKARALLGMPADTDWILYAPNGYDPVLIHNPFIHQLSRDMDRYSPRTRFVEVFLVQNAGSVRETHYQGLYVLEEKIKIGKGRVNIEHLDGEDLKPPRVSGGYIMKFDRLGPGESGFDASGDRGLVYVEPKEQTILLPQRAPQRKYLQSFLADFDGALRGAKWKDPVAGYRAFFDVEAAIDFHVLEVLSGNVDAMVLSTYFHKPRGGKIVCGPHWDFDRALGSLDPRDENPRQWETGPFFGGVWWPRLFSDPDFWQAWVDRWQDLRGNHFSSTNLNRLIDQLAEEVRDAQPRQYARWGFTPRGGSYQSEIALMKSWLSNRVDFIDRQLAQPPHFNQSGGRVPKEFLLTLTAPNLSTNGAIYYTLDGSDPRLSQGAISTNAIRYSTPLPIRSSTNVRARVHDPVRRQEGGPQSSTPWSAPISTRFEVATP